MGHLFASFSLFTGRLALRTLGKRFVEIEAQLSPNYRQLELSESAMHVRPLLSAMFREAHREARGQRLKAQANVHGSLLSAFWPGPGSRPRVNARTA
jgi:hypothetical protein